MKTTESVIKSFETAAAKFVVTNRRQLIATLPKADRPARRTVRSAAPAVNVQEALNNSRLIPLAAIRRQAARYKTLQVVREGTMVKLVNRKTKHVIATVTVELGERGRTLIAQLENYLGYPRPFSHSYGRSLRYSAMLANMEVDAKTASPAEQTRRLRAYIQDDIGELVDDLVTAYGVALRKYKEDFDKQQARSAKIKASPAYIAKYGKR